MANDSKQLPPAIDPIDVARAAIKNQYPTDEIQKQVGQDALQRGFEPRIETTDKREPWDLPLKLKLQIFVKQPLTERFAFMKSVKAAIKDIPKSFSIAFSIISAKWKRATYKGKHVKQSNNKLVPSDTRNTQPLKVSVPSVADALQKPIRTKPKNKPIKVSRFHRHHHGRRTNNVLGTEQALMRSSIQKTK